MNIISKNAAASPQSSRQRVRTALAHRLPDRVPFSWQFCATPEMNACLQRDFAGRGWSWDALRKHTEDIVAVSPDYCGPADRGGGTWNVWGIGWKSVNYGVGTYEEVETYPLAGVESLAALDDYPWPDPDWYDYGGLAGKVRRIGSEKAVKFSALNPFETLCWMMGLEETLCNCAVQPQLVVRALEHIVAFYEKRLERAMAVIGDRVDIVFFADDLGTQNGPIMSPAMYRDIIKPFHRRLFARSRQIAPEARVMMHSDGSVFAMLDDLIDAGLEVLEAVQLDCADMEPVKLKDSFGDRLSFHGAISVQQLLPNSDAATVEQTCRDLVRILGTGGGYVAAPSHAIQMGTPVDNVLAMLKGVLGLQNYNVALEIAKVNNT